MIRPKRLWHRGIWMLLALVIPLMILLAVRARNPVPVMDRIPLQTEESP